MKMMATLCFIVKESVQFFKMNIIDCAAFIFFQNDGISTSTKNFENEIHCHNAKQLFILNFFFVWVCLFNSKIF